MHGLNRNHEICVVFSDPPSVTPIPEDGLLEVQLGEDVVMGCKASGVPHPIVTWSNEVQLMQNRMTLMTLFCSGH